MAKPIKSEVITGEYSLFGSPWVNVTGQDTINPDTLEYSLFGSPWHGAKPDENAPVVALKLNGVVLTNTEVINGVSGAAVSHINSIEF